MRYVLSLSLNLLASHTPFILLLVYFTIKNIKERLKMIKVYGIKTCGSVKKATKFLNESNIEYEFIDFKKTNVTEKEIDYWLSKVSIDVLFNNRGTKYRTLKLKELNLDDKGKKEWLLKENMLIKRPVIEYGEQVIVGFDEEKYQQIFK
jgi:Spx/MgsR family transcriptional regulator